MDAVARSDDRADVPALPRTVSGQQALELMCDLVEVDPTVSLVAFDRDLRITHLSEGLARRCGLGGDAVGKLVSDCLPMLDAREEPLLREVFAGRASVSRELEDATGSCFDVHYAPLSITGRVVGGVALLRDTTARRDRERDLFETERRFKNMANVAPVLLWMSRPDAMCTFFNQTWLDFTGRTLEQEWGVGWAEGIHFEDLQPSLDAYMDAFAARRVFEIEYRLRRADGEYRWILDRGTPRYDSDGNFAGYIGSCVDITEYRRLEVELRGALATKDEFLGLVSHELRTPITSLRLLLERLNEESPADLTPHHANLIGRMDKAVTRLTQMIESVLHFSRVQSGRLRVVPRRIDLLALLEPLIDELRLSATQKELALVLAAPEDLPPLVTDPQMIHLIVSNLVTNAIKFTDQGTVEVVLSYDDRGHRIVVTDTGRGIAPGVQTRVFEPFEQLEPTHQKHKPGVGLGLALVKAMTAALGGSIELRSAPGRGSTFTVIFPPRGTG